MSRTCLACTHQDRESINQAIVTNDVSNRMIATQFSLSEAGVRRHREKHLPVTLVKAKEAEEVASGDDLLQQVRDLQQKALGILKTAEAAGDLKIALNAIRETRGCLELLAKLVYVLAKDQAEERKTVTFVIGRGFVGNDDPQTLAMTARAASSKA